MDELFSIWGIWFNGSKIPDGYELWGKTIVFWARFGKIIAFIAVLFIVIEIIGQPRLEEWAKSLEREKVHRFYEETRDMLYGSIINAIRVTNEAAILFSILVIIVRMFTFDVGNLIVIASRFALYVIAKLLIAFMKHRHLENVFRIASVLLVAIGFHFDLLAS